MLQVGPCFATGLQKAAHRRLFLWTGGICFNMLALYFFADTVLQSFGSLDSGDFLAIVASSSFSVFYHKRDYAYRAVGASGGVSGILRSILLYPDYGSTSFTSRNCSRLSLRYCILLYSVYGMRHSLDHVGHTAHFAGLWRRPHQPFAGAR